MSSLCAHPHIFKYVDDLKLDGFLLPNSGQTFRGKNTSVPLGSMQTISRHVNVCKESRMSLWSRIMSQLGNKHDRYKCWYLCRFRSDSLLPTLAELFLIRGWSEYIIWPNDPVVWGVYRHNLNDTDSISQTSNIKHFWYLQFKLKYCSRAWFHKKGAIIQPFI